MFIRLTQKWIIYYESCFCLLTSKRTWTAVATDKGREARLWPAQNYHFHSAWATCPSHRSQPSPCTCCVTDAISSTASRLCSYNSKQKSKKIRNYSQFCEFLNSLNGTKKEIVRGKIIMPFLDVLSFSGLLFSEAKVLSIEDMSHLSFCDNGQSLWWRRYKLGTWFLFNIIRKNYRLRQMEVLLNGTREFSRQVNIWNF